MTGSIDWEQDWPGNAAADQTSNNRELKEAKEKIGVETLMLENERIWNRPEGGKPVEPA